MEHLLSSAHVVDTTAKQVISRRIKNENVFKTSKKMENTQKACKNTVFHCQMCKFVGFLLPSSSWLLKLPKERSRTFKNAKYKTLLFFILKYANLWRSCRCCRRGCLIKLPNFGWGNEDITKQTLGSLSNHDDDGSENVIWKCNFAFLQSFFNYSKSLCWKCVLTILELNWNQRLGY